MDITASASPSGHYDPKNDVILSLEVMGATQTRVRPRLRSSAYVRA